MKLKFSTIKVILILFCAAAFACSQTDVKQDDLAPSLVSVAERSVSNIAEKATEENTMSLLEFLELMTGGTVPIQTLTEVPVEWKTPVQEMTQLVQKYAVDSLDEFRTTHANMIIEDSPGYIRAYDETESLDITVELTSLDDIPVRILLKERNEAETMFEATAYIRRDTHAISEICQLEQRWPGFHFVRFHPNGKVYQLSYSPTADGKALIAQFDEGGQLSECYALPLDAQGPLIQF